MARSRLRRAAVHVRVSTHDQTVEKFARQPSIAINPLPHKTRFHELAHVLLGHTAEGEQGDSDLTRREAESAAMFCSAALDLPDTAGSRGYIRSWWGQGNPIPERSAQHIFKTANQSLTAGTADQGVSS